MSILRTTMNWDQQQSLELLAELKKFEILWNPKHKSYYHSARKEEAWKQLAEDLDVDVGEVKRKVDSLRGSFRREKSRIKRTEAAAKVKGDVYVSNWFAYEAMKFLDCHDQRKIKLHSVKGEQDPITIDEESNLMENESEVENEEECDSEIFENETKMKTFVSPLKLVRKRRTFDDTMSHKAYKLLKHVSAAKKDECTIYGEYIAEKLRKLDEFARAQAQHRINNAIFEVEIDFYSKYHNVTSYQSEPTTSQSLSFDSALSPFQSPKSEVISDVND